jgi:hypothetical protein
MKFSALLFATFVSSMPSYSSGNGGNNGGGYGNMSNPSGMQLGVGLQNGGGRRYKGSNGNNYNQGNQGGDYGQGGYDMGGGNYGQGNQGSGDDYSPSPSPGTGGGDQGSADDQAKLDELNAIRAKVGAPPLQLSSKLTQAAQKHSDDQAKMRNMSHTGSDGSSPTQRINRAGIKGGQTGENVAWNQRDWSAATQVWVKSPGHYKNMIDKGFKYVGFGATNKYYTEDFSSTN